MSEEDDKPNRQVESVRLNIGEEVMDQGGKNAWVALRELGKGAFGTVYHVVNKNTKQEAALKIERITAGDNLLKIEREIMLAMQPEATAIHIFDDGIYNDFRFIVMTLCGPDLQKIADLMNNTFRPETIIRVCIRTLLAIKHLHEYEYVHRDLKPCNFAVDFNPNSLHIYLFDYGMARKYAKMENGKWFLRRPRETAQFRGTARYCSLNSHKRKELGRIDDVWSWFYMMMEMHKPLPWSATTNQDKIEAWKEEHLLNYLSKDPFLSKLLAVHKILHHDYSLRPEYNEIYDLLLGILKDVNGKLSGPMEYDSARINALVAELGESARPKEISRMEDETAIANYLSAQFHKKVVPGGGELILPDLVNFFGIIEPKKAKEEKTDENKKHHHHRLSSANIKNKMLGKPKQPASGTGKKDGHSSTINSRVSLQKTKIKSKGLKK